MMRISQALSGRYDPLQGLNEHQVRRLAILALTHAEVYEGTRDNLAIVMAVREILSLPLVEEAR